MDFSDVLLTVDYDRTLTAPDSTIPERNLEAIRYFMASGGAFTVNTGRSVPMIQAFRDIVPVNAPLLLYNGSAAYDLATGKFEFCHPIPLDAWVPGSVAAETGISCRKPGFRAKYLEKTAPARILKTEKKPTTAEGKEGCCASNRRADKQHGAGSLFSRAAPTVLRRALFVSPNGLLPRSGKLF